MCVGDYDNDGYEDLYVAYYGKNVLYHNNGNSTFAHVSEEPELRATANRGARAAHSWIMIQGTSFLHVERCSRDVRAARIVVGKKHSVSQSQPLQTVLTQLAKASFGIENFFERERQPRAAASGES
jgi:VCBS repeat protein